MKRLHGIAVLAIVAVTALAASLSARAGAGGSPATPNWALVYVGDYSDKGLSHRDLFITTANGSVTRQLTNDTLADDNPVWAPDGSRIAFVRQQIAGYTSAVGGIYSIKPDGTGLTLLYDLSNANDNIGFDNSSGACMSWSPNGKKIVFPGWGPNFNGAQLYVLDVASGVVQNLTPVFGVIDARSPRWSPVLYSDAAGSHSRISFAGYDPGGSSGHELMVLDVTIGTDGTLTTGVRTLTAATLDLLPKKKN